MTKLNHLKRYIDDVMLGKQPDFYKTSDEVKKAFSKQVVFAEDNAFTFGNAQNLINMTARYMFIKTYKSECLRSNFSICHCPMDGIMIDVVIQEVKALDDEERSRLCQSIKSERFRNNRGWVSLLRRLWSKMGDDLDSKEQNELFQEIARFLAEKNGMNPIEFDYYRWSAVR